jgi:hypothetical protein
MFNLREQVKHRLRHRRGDGLSHSAQPKFAPIFLSLGESGHFNSKGRERRQGTNAMLAGKDGRARLSTPHHPTPPPPSTWGCFRPSPTCVKATSTLILASPQSTGAAKLKALRTMLRIQKLDPSWTLPSRVDSNPMNRTRRCSKARAAMLQPVAGDTCHSCVWSSAFCTAGNVK